MFSKRIKGKGDCGGLIPHNPLLQFLRPLLQAVGTAVKELQDRPEGVVVDKGVGLVGVHMHGQPEVWMDADDHIRVDQRALIAFRDHEDLVLVFDLHLEGIHRRHMDMAFGHHQSLGNLQAPAGRMAQDAARCTVHVAGLADDGGEAQLPGVRHRHLDLGGGAEGA